MAKAKLTPEQKAAKAASKKPAKVWLTPTHKAVAGFAATAVGMAKLNNFEGVQGFGHGGSAVAGAKVAAKDKNGNPIKDKKGNQVMINQEHANMGNMVMNKFGSKTGSLYHLPLDSDRMKELRSLAKAAAPDLGGTVKGQMNYSGSVKAFLEALLVGGSGGGGGSKITSRDNTGLMGAL